MENLTIIENGEQMDINVGQRETLLKTDLIYYCTECNCYHIKSEKSFFDIDISLKN